MLSNAQTRVLASIRAAFATATDVERANGYFGYGAEKRSLRVLATFGLVEQRANGNWYLVEQSTDKLIDEITERHDLCGRHGHPRSGAGCPDCNAAEGALTPIMLTDSGKAKVAEHLASRPIKREANILNPTGDDNGQWGAWLTKAMLNGRNAFGQFRADHIKALGMNVSRLCGHRSPIRTHVPTDGMSGTSRSWRREIGANDYSFTVVNMPNGELRLFVSVYNGYGADGPDVEQFKLYSCAWTRVHAITLRPAVTMDRITTKPVVCMECGAGFATVAESADHEHMKPEWFDRQPSIGEAIADMLERDNPRDDTCAVATPLCGPRTVILACCGCGVCSHCAVVALTQCPACGSVMAPALAAFDAARTAGYGDFSPITSTLTVSASHDLPGTRDVSRHEPHFGVLVEYWDDDRGGVVAVIGDYSTYEIAVAERDRFERMERFEYVRGVVPLYATLDDF